MNEQEYMLGALKSPVDDRDWCVKVSAPLTAPAELYLKERAAYNQGQYGTCVLQVASRGENEYHNTPMGIFVPYGRWRSHMLQGLYPNEAYTYLCKEGMAPKAKLQEKELEMPKAAAQAKTLADNFLAAAAPYAGGSWHRLTTEDEIKAALMQIKALEGEGIYGAHVGMCFGVAGYYPDKYNVWHGYSEKSAQLIGLHWMYVAGWGQHETWPFGEKEELVRVLNSWGTGWGDNGYCWLSWEDVLRQHDIIAWFPPYEEKEDDPVIRRRTLRKGMTGEDVAELQSDLIDLDYDLGKWGADGDFGSKTRSAVKSFQRVHGLKADGIVGPLTWGVLDRL